MRKKQEEFTLHLETKCFGEQAFPTSTAIQMTLERFQDLEHNEEYY